MDSHSHSSPVYRPRGESDREESSESPVYQPSPYPNARARAELNTNWIRNPRTSPPRNPYQAPHLHHRFSSPPRDPYLAPTPTLRARHTGVPAVAMGIPVSNIPRFLGTKEFMRREIEHRAQHDLLNQRINDLADQIWIQEEKIVTLEEDREILQHRTETTRAEARFVIRVTIAVLVVVLTCFLVESYLRRA
ncbi:hypothetical protein L1987_29347 [Smallanthus sonchifolius]|uniref:Uncharacterized protein n=1 Tax=Smallanthus sonchifolius TaxID=185202 RepID=A0ACB9I0Z0_9ASTR|nr:hypothetical protein L1987_29347 [Smallanthus sonchifolius]